ncbi:MAG: HNH endonuclease family protein [bacterium]|nr:HNH endonuclease family protein [bacterium]
MLLLAVAFVAIVVAAVVFAGPRAGTEPAAVAAGVSDTPTTEADDATPPQPAPAAAQNTAPPAAAATPPPAAATSAAGVSSDPGGVNELIAQLRPLVAEPAAAIPDYDRDRFAGWLDRDGDCVNTRHEILQAEARYFSMAQSGCSVASGEWFDPYTARTYTNPRDLDVDHVVALADAWVSGAYAWADDLLDRFSNDLGNLNAIEAGENRSKSAKGPADYTPSAAGARCDYLVQYATVKVRWQLSITPADFAATERGLAGCDPRAEAAGGIEPVAPRTAARPPSAPRASTTTALPGCHPDYRPCLPNLPGDALNCGDLTKEQKPVRVLAVGTDPYRLDRDRDGRACTS